MGYSKEIYIRCLDILKKRKELSERQQLINKQKAVEIIPRIEQIDKELSKTSIKLTRLIIGSSENTEKLLGELKEKNLELQKERVELLVLNGLPSDFLDIHYFCKTCEDSGYIRNNMCECLKKLLRDESFSSLNNSSPLKLCSFSTFSPGYYPNVTDKKLNKSIKAWMQDIYQYCKDYAEDFDLSSPNLLLLGNTGLGKTHLSLSIANEVIAKEYGVVYGSVPNLFSVLEKERFSANQYDDTDSLSELLNCDLLILDDLGAEMTTQFTISTLYNIINSRLLTGKVTIINTNLTIDEIEARYGQRIASRLIGDYEQLLFLGNDIRQILKNAR